MIIPRYQLIEFPIADAFQPLKFQLTEQQYLRQVQILGIEVFAFEDMPKSATQNTLLTIAQLQKMWITFYTSDPSKITLNPNGTVQGDNQSEAIKRVPMLRLRNMDTGGTTQPHIRQQFQLPGQTIYWEQCFIELGSQLANSGTVSLCLGVTFQGTANG